MAIGVAGAANNAVAFATTGISVWSYGTTAAVIYYTSTISAGNTRSVVLTGPDANTDTIDTLNLYDNTNKPGMWSATGGNDVRGANGITLNHWSIIVVGKDTGTTTPRCSIFDFTTGGWVHSNGDLTDADSASTGAVDYSINGFMNGSFQGIDGAYAAVATWHKRNLSDGERARLAGGNWNKYSPDVLVEFRSGRTALGAGPLDHGIQRMITSQFGSAITRATLPDPPGFRFSMLGRRR